MEQLDQDNVDAPRLNSFKNILNKIRCTRTQGWVSSWTSPLNPRPCHVGWPQDNAAQGEHIFRNVLMLIPTLLHLWLQHRTLGW